ncbi:MAG: dienelactone hydrolase [Rhodobacteraceae bacterium]|nr:dienelactone hydrolase [Paracoccaceae bacterium]
MKLPSTRRGILIWIGAALIALLALGMAGQAAMRVLGLSLNRTSPEALSALLRPVYGVRLPEGEGPFPTALLASGCDGPQDNLETWADTLNSIGWAAIIVDSHEPRGYDADPTWRLVCTGAMLPGGARAGDLAVALADARAMPFVDPDRLALIGASHGGWAVLDLLVLADLGRRPENLTRWPEAPGDDPLAGVVAVAAIYPYCGEASRVKRAGWERNVAVLLVLVEDDTVVDESDCRALAERARSEGLPVTVDVIPNVTHGFDQRSKSFASTLLFDSDATQHLMTQFRRFFAKAVDP